MARTGRPPLSRCKVCGEKVADRSELSARGKHIGCSVERMNANNIQLHEKRGPFFVYWRRRCLAAFGAGLLDDAPEKP